MDAFTEDEMKLVRDFFYELGKRKASLEYATEGFGEIQARLDKALDERDEVRRELVRAVDHEQSRCARVICEYQGRLGKMSLEEVEHLLDLC